MNEILRTKLFSPITIDFRYEKNYTIKMPKNIHSRRNFFQEQD